MGTSGAEGVETGSEVDKVCAPAFVEDVMEKGGVGDEEKEEEEYSEGVIFS